MNCYQHLYCRPHMAILQPSASPHGVWGYSGISGTICKQSAPHSRQITTSTPHHSIFTGRMRFFMPNQQCQALKAELSTTLLKKGNSIHDKTSVVNKKLSYCRGTARYVLSVVILQITTQQCRNYLYDKS